jgi:hypothetical protein
MSGRTVPKGVGYWGAGEGPGLRALPRPQTLVRPRWHVEDRHRIVAYLRSGAVCLASPGLGSCRFTECSNGYLGSCDLTDGEWLWPQGLEHYLQVHHVCLPEEFVETMRTNGWQIPPDLDEGEVLTAMEETGQPFGDLSWWLDWASRAAGPCSAAPPGL